MNQRVCKKCLLRETSEEAYFQNLYLYIENILVLIKVGKIGDGYILICTRPQFQTVDK
jgi:hypothetical protein